MKDLRIRESYTDGKGVEQVSWNKIGILIDGKNGKQYVKLYHLPGVLVSVFEQKKREQKEVKEVPDIGLDNAIPVEDVELA